MALSLRGKIKRAFEKIKAKLPKFKRKETKVIKEEIDKQSDIINKEVIDKIEQLEKEINDLKNTTKTQNRLNVGLEKDNRLLEKNLKAQPIIQIQTAKERIKGKRKKIRLRRFTTNIYVLSISYVWHVSFVNPPSSPEFASKSANVDVEILAKTPEKAVKMGISEGKKIGVMVKNELLNVVGSGRILYFSIFDTSNLLTENGALVFNYGSLFGENG